jgi:hypothetical protein
MILHYNFTGAIYFTHQQTLATKLKSVLSSHPECEGLALPLWTTAVGAPAPIWVDLSVSTRSGVVLKSNSYTTTASASASAEAHQPVGKRRLGGEVMVGANNHSVSAALHVVPHNGSKVVTVVGGGHVVSAAAVAEARVAPTGITSVIIKGISEKTRNARRYPFASDDAAKSQCLTFLANALHITRLPVSQHKSTIAKNAWIW